MCNFQQEKYAEKDSDHYLPLLFFFFLNKTNLSRKGGGLFNSGSLHDALGLERKKTFSHIHFHFPSPLLLIMSSLRSDHTSHSFSVFAFTCFHRSLLPEHGIHLAPTLLFTRPPNCDRFSELMGLLQFLSCTRTEEQVLSISLSEIGPTTMSSLCLVASNRNRTMCWDWNQNSGCFELGEQEKSRGTNTTILENKN